MAIAPRWVGGLGLARWGTPRSMPTKVRLICATPEGEWLLGPFNWVMGLCVDDVQILKRCSCHLHLGTLLLLLLGSCSSRIGQGLLMTR